MTQGPRDTNKEGSRGKHRSPQKKEIKKKFVGGLWADWDENRRDQVVGWGEWSRRVVGEINGIGGLWGAIWRVSAV